MNIKILGAIFILLISLTLVSSVSIESVSQDALYPGQTAKIKIELKNNLNEDIEDVRMILDLSKTAFTTLGSSEDSESLINEDEKESFNFEIKAPSNIKPGDYNVPYTILYLDSNDDEKTISGSFGVSVSAKTELSYTIDAQENYLGGKSKLSIKVINSGLGDIGFLNVKIISTKGIEVLNSYEEYIGTVSSDDFELATFDVLYESTGAYVNAIISYKDSENNPKSETVNLQVKVYTQEKAIELGILKKSKLSTYIFGVIILVILWFVWRYWKKSRKKNKEEY